MLFDNNMDMNMIMNLSNMNLNSINEIEKINDLNNSKLTNDKTGLQRGNMFNNEYKPYKNYNPSSIDAKTEKDDLLLKLYETNFAIIDLNLYLDLHPNDFDMYQIYKEYINKFDSFKKMYEKNYGPLENTCIENNNYDWIKNPWPWDKDGGTKYV